MVAINFSRFFFRHRTKTYMRKNFAARAFWAQESAHDYSVHRVDEQQLWLNIS